MNFGTDSLPVNHVRQKSLLEIKLFEGGDSRILSLEEEIVINSQPAPELKRLGLKTSYIRTGDRISCKLETGNIVGSAILRYQHTELLVSINPKVHGATVLRMMAALGEAPKVNREEINMDSTNDSPTSMLIEYVIEKIRIFMQGSGFRDYIRIKDSNPRGIKGCVDLGAYVKTSFPRLNWSTIPCTNFDYTSDVPENQIIAQALSIATRLLTLVHPERRKNVLENIFRAKRHLINVTVPSTSSKINVRYRKGNMHFKEIHALCKILVDKTNIDFGVNSNSTFSAFSIDMAALFERYVRHAFVAAVGEHSFRSKSELIHRWGNSQREIRLDGLASILGQTAVVECKYKLIDSAEGRPEKYLSEADVYQTIAYANHSKVNATQIALIFPTSDDNIVFDCVATFSDFNSAHGKPLPLTIYLLNLLKPIDEVSRRIVQEFS